MFKKKENLLFNIIAPIYGLFYNSQMRNYTNIIDKAKEEIDIIRYDKIIDIGCGTGAFCGVLKEKGIDVTGIDPAKKMLRIAKKKNEKVNFYKADVLKGLPFKDKTFDIAFSSYVAHGLKANERKKMYTEMSRLAKDYVIIHDYNKKKSILTSIIEWLEGGDYFYFIEHAEPEMKDCVSEMKTCFSDVKVINVNVRANWYLCKPKK